MLIISPPAPASRGRMTDGVIGRRQPHEVVHPVGLRGQRGQLDVLHADARVLGVEPEGVELAVLADDLDQLRAEELADGEDPDDLALGRATA